MQYEQGTYLGSQGFANALQKNVLTGFRHVEIVQRSQEGHCFLGGPPSADAGLWILVVPVGSDLAQTEASVVDLFHLGLKQSSVRSLLESLHNSQTFEMQPGNTKVRMDDTCISFRFRYRHSPEQEFNVSFDENNTEELIRWLARSSGTSRNAPCPCASGTKFKGCCSQNKWAIWDARDVMRHLMMTPSELEPILEVAQHPDGEVINNFIDAAVSDPKVLQDSDYWVNLGAHVGVMEYGEQAIYCFTQALELDPINHEARLDLAATVSWSRGQHDHALMLINDVPEGYERRLVIEANVLSAKGEKESAIPLYERAIFEEPEFALPYDNLLSILEETDHPLYGYWIDQAARMLPSSPVIADHYARYLWRERRLEELSSSDWIDEAESEADPSIIGRADYASQSTQASILRQLADVVLNPTEQRVKALGYRVAIIDLETHLCDVGNKLSVLCAQLGITELIEPLYGRVCDSCIENRTNGIPRSVDTLLAVGHLVLGEHAATITHCEQVLEKYPDADECLQPYYWALDDIGRTEDAIGIARRIFDIDPSWNHVSHNLGAMTQSMGRLGEARYYYQLQLEKETHLRAQKALVLLDIVEKRFDESRRRFEQWCSMMRDPQGAANIEQSKGELLGADDSESQNLISAVNWTSLIDADLAAQRKVFEELLSFGESNSSSITFTSDVLEKNNSYGDLKFGPESTLRPETYSIDNLFDSSNHGNQADLNQTKFLLQLEQRGDFSIARASIIDSLPRFDDLAWEAKASLLEGERRFMSDTPMADYSTVAVSFAKAVEICLLQHIFSPFKSMYQILKITHNQFKLDQQDSQSQAASLFKFIEKSHHLELGGMAHVFRLCNGKTSEKEFLVGQLRDFVRQSLNGHGLLDANIVDKIGSIANDFRNPGAHAVILSHEQSEECRNLCFSVLHEIETCLDGRAVTS